MDGFTFSPELIWAILGIVLLALELVTFTFILSFFGIGAILTALTTWTGLTPEISSQLGVFSVTSLLAVFLFRKTAKKMFAGTNDRVPEYVGEKVTVLKEIPVDGEGVIAYRGSEWIAFSDHTESISEGSKVEIFAIEGIRVKVKPVL
ncbi:MAG: NfeD family protein [Bacteroidetes bacterium]|nr:NfeD family protein [Bacteroidota bacterium]